MTEYKDLTRDQKVFDDAIGETLWTCMEGLDPWEIAEYLRLKADEVETIFDEELEDE